jgi:2-polyprenyl-3-methyl-5-hydroxy-6-metoxy-1,4-benzoquinol methylase
VGAWFLEVQARTTGDLLAGLSGESALDVGGGHGQLVEPLSKRGFALTILGSQETPPERLRPFLEGGGCFVSGPLLPLPFPYRSFDVVTAYRLLPHVDRWREFILELCRVARRAVLVDYPTLRSVNAGADLLFRWKKDVEGDTRPFRVFRDAEVREAFEAGGLRVTGRRGEFVLPMALHRALGLPPLSRGVEASLGLLGLHRLLGSPVILRGERG